MKQTTMKLRIVTLVLVFATVLVSCSKKELQQTQKPLESIRIGYVPYSSSMPALVAVEKGFAKAQGLDVQLVRLETSNEAIIALTKGDIQGLMGIGLPSLLAIEVKTPGTFKFIWYAVETGPHSVNALLVPVKSEATDIESLRGKTVGTFSGATQLLNLQAIFKTALGDTDAVKISQVAPNLQLQALENGEIAALFTIEPQVTIATEKGIGRILVDNPRSKYIMDPFPGGGGVLATAFITAKPELAKKLRTAFDSAIESIRADESAAKSLLPKYAPVESEIAAKTRLYGWWTSSQVDLKSLQSMADLLEHDGIVKGHVDVKNIVMPGE
ncbi:MAG: ABC transporter substrate-binding protein [Candidatus Hydrogenedentes bacterium]|nr:ABC transporter substrate-binding protein [Candidatus Hydrogenedentota bacterium]